MNIKMFLFFNKYTEIIQISVYLITLKFNKN